MTPTTNSPTAIHSFEKGVATQYDAPIAPHRARALLTAWPVDLIWVG